MATSPEMRRREARGRGRLCTERLICNLGEVVDISATGFRLRTKRLPGVRVGEQCRITLRIDDHRLTIFVLATWVRRVGFRRFEAGLRFVDPTPTESTKIMEIARVASLYSIQPIKRG